MVTRAEAVEWWRPHLERPMFVFGSNETIKPLLNPDDWHEAPEHIGRCEIKAFLDFIYGDFRPDEDPPLP